MFDGFSGIHQTAFQHLIIRLSRLYQCLASAYIKILIMKFLGALWALILGIFPYEMDKVKRRTISEIFILTAGELSYTGDFKKSVDTNTPDVATTNKLAAGEDFSVAGHSLEIAKIPIVDGVERPRLAKWMNYVDPEVFTGAGEADQLRQLYAQDALLQFYYGDSDTPVGISAQTDHFQATEPAMAGVGDYHRFVPSLKFYVMNGDFSNKVVLTLPEGSLTDALGGGTDYKIGLRISKRGLDTTEVCAKNDVLYSLPAGCDENCGCADGTAVASVHKGKMVANSTKDHGILA